MAKSSKHETLFAACWPKSAPPFSREYRFDELDDRKWRFDFAWPSHRVSVEIAGATFVQGRHSRGLGMAKDAEKMRAASLQGWHVLPYTDVDFRERRIEDIIAEVRQLLDAKGPNYDLTPNPKET